MIAEKKVGPARVVVAGDHHLFRQGLVVLLSTRDEVVVIGEAWTSAEALRLACDTKADVLLLDVGMDDDVPASARIRTLRRLSPQTQVIVLTRHRDRVLRETLHEAGASACITKGASLDELFSAISSARTQVVDPGVQRQRELLTRREREVLRLLSQGCSNRSVARQLTIAEGTVKRHTNSIYRKLRVGSRIEAVNKGLLLGVIPRGGG
jgi:DNA-binding NarL/FixJ family response regulator